MISFAPSIASLLKLGCRELEKGLGLEIFALEKLIYLSKQCVIFRKWKGPCGIFWGEEVFSWSLSWMNGWRSFWSLGLLVTRWKFVSSPWTVIITISLVGTFSVLAWDLILETYSSFILFKGTWATTLSGFLEGRKSETYNGLQLGHSARYGSYRMLEINFKKHESKKWKKREGYLSWLHSGCCIPICLCWIQFPNSQRWFDVSTVQFDVPT